MKLLPVVTLLATFSLTGCGGAEDADVVLYKPTGSLQCAPTQSTQVRLNAEVSALRMAGATVNSSRCATDGLARIAVCGVENGDLFSVTVSGTSETAAAQLGYKGADSYPGARPSVCQ